MSTSAGAGTFAGTATFARLAFRRDRLMIPIWIYALAGLVIGTAYSFKKLYPTELSRQLFAATADLNPSLRAFYGPIYGTSIGSLTAWRYGAFAAAGAALMSIFIVIRHTRADEETGRLELLGSASVGRHAALTAAAAVSVAANLIVAVVMAAGLIALGIGAAGAIALTLAICGCGLVFTAVAAVSAQLAESARAARGIAIFALGAAYVLRAVGDAAGASGLNWLTWLSPVGWSELIRPFGQIRWWILALPAATGLVFAVVAAVLAARRDYGAGMLPQRPGPARAAAWMRSSWALAWRLQRGTLAAWVLAGLCFSVLFGAAAKGISGLLSTKAMQQALVRLGGQAGLTNAYLAAIMGLVGVLAAGYAVSAVLRLRSEETADRADPILATGTGRVSWGLSHILIAAGGTVILLASMGLGAGLGYVARSGGGWHQIEQLIGAGLVQVPAALTVAGIAAVLIGFAPRASVAGGWAVLGFVVLMVFLAALLQLSHWVQDISPFTHVPKLPGVAVSATPLVVLSVIALGLGVASVAGLRRRDIG